MGAAAETIEKERVIQALVLALKAATSHADLPHLHDVQYGEVVAIGTVAICLDLMEVYRTTSDLLGASSRAEMARLQEAVDGGLARSGR